MDGAEEDDHIENVEVRKDEVIVHPLARPAQHCVLIFLGLVQSLQVLTPFEVLSGH